MERGIIQHNCSDNHCSQDAYNQDIANVEYNLSYFCLFRQLYSQSQKLQHEYIEVQKRQSKINTKLSFLSERAQNFKDKFRPEIKIEKKIDRRGQDQISKEYYCTNHQCPRAYESEAACRRHIKLKHPQEYQPKIRGRQKIQEQGINDFITLNF